MDKELFNKLSEVTDKQRKNMTEEELSKIETVGKIASDLMMEQAIILKKIYLTSPKMFKTLYGTIVFTILAYVCKDTDEMLAIIEWLRKDVRDNIGKFETQIVNKI